MKKANSKESEKSNKSHNEKLDKLVEIIEEAARQTEEMTAQLKQLIGTGAKAGKKG